MENNISKPETPKEKELQRKKFNELVKTLDFPAAQAMIDAGYDVNEENWHGNNSLHDNVLTNPININYPIIEFLLENGANPNHKNLLNESLKSHLSKHSGVQNHFINKACDMLKERIKQEITVKYDWYQKTLKRNNCSLSNTLEKTKALQSLRTTMQKLAIRPTKMIISRTCRAAINELKPFLVEQAYRTYEQQHKLHENKEFNFNTSKPRNHFTDNVPSLYNETAKVIADYSTFNVFYQHDLADELKVLNLEVDEPRVEAIKSKVAEQVKVNAQTANSNEATNEVDVAMHL